MDNLLSKGTNNLWRGLPLFITAIRSGGELDHCVQRNFDVRKIGLGQVMEVCIAEREVEAQR